MIRATLLVVLAAFLLGRDAQQQQPVFRAGVDLVHFSVVVSDKNGVPVSIKAGETSTVAQYHLNPK